MKIMTWYTFQNPYMKFPDISLTFAPFQNFPDIFSNSLTIPWPWKNKFFRTFPWRVATLVVNCWQEHSHKFKTEYLLILQKYLSTWTSIKYFGHQVQVSTKYFWISKDQVQVSTKYSIICIKYQVQLLYLTPTLLSNIKLCVSFHHRMWIRTGVTVRKRLSWVLTSVTLTFDLWPWPFAWTLLLSLVITPGNFMMIRWWEHSEKGVTDGRTDGKYHL